jgi:hypothetical protein
MLTTLRNLFKGPSGKTTSTTTRQRTTTTRLEVEGLEERAVLSTVPILTGDILTFGGNGAHSLQITSETVTGYGTATFTGYFQDQAHGVATNVQGYMWLKSPSIGGYSVRVSDFGMSYFGGTSNGFYSAGVSGWGDFYTSAVTSYAPAYQGSAGWWYTGGDYNYASWNLGWLNWSSSGFNSDYSDEYQAFLYYSSHSNIDGGSYGGSAGNPVYN